MIETMAGADSVKKRAASLLLVLVVVLLTPSRATGDGGGPILIYAGPIAFFVAQVWIIAIELFVLRRLLPGMSWPDAWGDVVATNLRSYLVVGLLFPVAFSVAVPLVGAAAGFGLEAAGLPGMAGRVSGALFGAGGWVVNDENVVRGLPYGLVVWFVATFFLTVRVEGQALARRWTARRFASSVPPMRASWRLNAASYAGLTVGVIWILIEIVRSRNAG
jgi:hypothetical protein